jgi:hypothetical protein
MVGHTVLLELQTDNQELAEAEAAMLLFMVVMVPLLAVVVVLASSSFDTHKHSHLQQLLQEMYRLVMQVDIKYILGLLQVQ